MGLVTVSTGEVVIRMPLWQRAVTTRPCPKSHLIGCHSLMTTHIDYASLRNLSFVLRNIDGPLEPKFSY